MKVPFLDLSLQHRALREPALAALTATYDATRFCLGKDVEDFERNFGATLGYPRVLGMNSGTAPLHVACMIAGFGPGDEVITSPFTFISSAWGINYVGAKPVFADIDEGTFNLDPAKVAAAITPRTKGIIVVHLFGQPARMDEIMAIARQHNLFVIEDCAQAVGASHLSASGSATPVGLIGDAGTFSFYPTKNLGGCGEGGAFVSRREEIQTRARHVRVHGSDRRYYHDIVGGNFRMDGFQGALLNVKLPHLAGWTARRRAIAGRYLSEIKLGDVRLPEQPAYGKSVFHQFTIRHPRRDALREHLTKQEVGTDLIYPVPLHLQKCYANLGRGPGSYPVAERAAANCVSLPIFPELTDAQVDQVIRAVNSF
ncbi:DegT/DnrJ/EryC1/StrS family aminotransferase [Opitutus sp. ER46]|uniref:DegT/DnrJ/EryC1/StrS family aminotransferase n=1 Tax=Opitutus sp. ER46 TaxID=2161864 RepID=UPI000D2FD939|nr:DegT/DnrJ/EryC1/StrS family aminotransferase [Opitutus sp. ER46]PTX94263.1 erythromycin biosynthesis sensory transduction protein eryC1 [Opitutus sp. ER46]